MDWEKGDKTLIQVDHSSISPDNGNTEIMTVYRYLVLLERHKKVTKYDMSYAQVSRLTGTDSDGFSVSANNSHKFRVMNDASKAPSCKTWFGDSIAQVASSNIVQKVFRFRFDRVNACSKIQKPYVVLKQPVSLKVGRPAKVSLVSPNLKLFVFSIKGLLSGRETG